VDPVTASLNLATALVTLAGKVWDATPKDVQAQLAGDYGKFLHTLAITIQPPAAAGK